MKTQFGQKFRIISAIEKSNVQLLSYLMVKQNHPPEKPIDKLGNNMFHLACSIGNIQMINYLYNTFQMDIEAYNSDGMNSMHLAACGGHLHVIAWLNDHGADCHSPTLYYNLTAYDIICKMIANKDPPDGFNVMNTVARSKLLQIKDFLREKYFEDHRGKEIRKFFWTFLKLKDRGTNIGRLPQGMIQKIAEYF